MKKKFFHTIIVEELTKKTINHNKLSQITGINRGTLSSVLNSNSAKLPSIDHLDKITQALGYREGWFYDHYIEEYFQGHTHHWKKLKPLLYRCIELNFSEKIEKILNWLTEDDSQISQIFNLAEQWYAEGERHALLLFYETVIKNEKNRHSERTILSHYRVFLLNSAGTDFESKLRAAIKFEPFYDELDLNYRLDALFKLINIYFIHRDWQKMYKYCAEMRVLATKAYEQRLHMQQKKNGDRIFITERHLVVYYAHSFLMEGLIADEQGDYAKSLSYIKHYNNLDWFEGLDETGRKEVEKIHNIAIANELSLHLLMGNTSKLSEYLQFLEQHPPEILPGMVTVLQAANKHDFSLDHIYPKLLQHLEYIESATHLKNNYYDNANTMDMLEKLYRQLAVYHFRQANYSEGIEYMSKCLAIANQINKKSEFTEYPELLKVLKEWSLLMQRHKES
ncbi:helix-turn-helix domain-containing protein [Paenibacillus wulumuqiensis]|uniref:helix-turn-helix domain-containing protein n=1 Tax=Paenibacillus wulumuqiensis TaxID=1567107 RepID=UPI000619F74D|nr:helix-turn-helix transcriptional regulator [Paenibacillus wulumuqiensis]